MKLLNNNILVSSEGYIDNVKGVIMDNSFNTHKATNVVATVLQVDDISEIREGAFCSGFTCNNPILKIGDKVIVEWQYIDRALSNEEYRFGNDLIIPYDSIIAIYDNGLIAMNGNVIFSDFTTKKIYTKGYEAQEEEFITGRVVSANNVTKYWLEYEDRKEEIKPNPIPEGCLVSLSTKYCRNIESDMYMLMDKKYAYVKSFNIITWQ